MTRMLKQIFSTLTCTAKLVLGVYLISNSVGNTAWARSDVYLCVDANGKKEYKNTGNVKGCTKLDFPSATPIAAPAPSANRKPATSATSATPAKAVNVPSSFPKIDESAQKARDSDRKQILLDEHKSEEQKLASLIKDFNNGAPERRAEDKTQEKYLERVQHMRADISRAEKNLEALKRELSKIK